MGKHGRERASNSPGPALELEWQTDRLSPWEKGKFLPSKTSGICAMAKDFTTFQINRCQHSGRSSPSELVSLINISLPLFWGKKVFFCSITGFLSLSANQSTLPVIIAALCLGLSGKLEYSSVTLSFLASQSRAPLEAELVP